MKHLGNFLVATLSSFGVLTVIPDSLGAASGITPTVAHSLEALISLITGLLSAILVAWLKQKFGKTKTD
jgi:hypothetical protein